MIRVKLLILDLGLVLVALFFATAALAHHINNEVTVNVDTHTHDNMLTSGMNDNDLAALLTVAASAGGHQFDFSTTDWQGSITGAWYDDEDAVSFGVAKRFSEDFLPNVLLHGNYTQNGSDDLWVIGGTFRF